MSQGEIIIMIIIGCIGTLFATFIVNIYKKISFIKRWNVAQYENNIGAVANDDAQKELIQSKQFIETRGYKCNPEDENNNDSDKNNSFLLVKKLLNDFYYAQKTLSEKRYLILGGSGMGKTTFLGALIYRYTHNNNLKKILPLYVTHLGKNSVLDELNSISVNRAKNTIIILDALDENVEAIRNPTSFWTELEKATDKFKIVIITSRTHFFDKEENEPDVWSILKNGSKNKFLSIERIYISPFDNDESNRFLQYKYQIGSNEYRKAKKLTFNSKDLISRPIVLQHIDKLLHLADKNELTKFELYSAIIDTWFKEEKQILPSYEISELWQLSKELALFMYENWIKPDGNASITEQQFDHFLTSRGYANTDDEKKSLRIRSLLNRNIDGTIKFSHRSFWEFFLAIYSIENPGLPFMANGAVGFAKEIYSLYLRNIYLPHVEYNKLMLEFPNTLLSETIQKLVISKTELDKLKDKSNTDAIHFIIYPVWYSLIQYFLYLTKDITGQQIPQYPNNESLNEQSRLYFLDNFNMLVKLSNVCVDFQSCFASDIEFSNAKKRIEEIYNDLNTFMGKSKPQEINSPFDYFGYSHKSLVVFPNFKYLLDKSYQNEFCIIGYGFNDKSDEDKTVNLFYQLDTNGSLRLHYCIIRELNHINEASDFIMKCHEHYNSLRGSSMTNNRIVFILYIGDYKLFFDSSSSYTKAEIEDYLRNMYKQMLIAH